MKTNEKEKVIELLRDFPVIKIATSKAGIARQTFYRWCNEDKSFEKESKKALKEGVLLIPS